MRHRDEGGSARRRARRARTRDARREHRRDTTRDRARHACTRTSRASTPRRSSSPRGGFRSQTMRPAGRTRARDALARAVRRSRSARVGNRAVEGFTPRRVRGSIGVATAGAGAGRSPARSRKPHHPSLSLSHSRANITRVCSSVRRDPRSDLAAASICANPARARAEKACQSTRRIQHPRCNPSRPRKGAPPSVPRGESGRESGSRDRSRALRRRATLACPDPLPLPPARRVPGRTIGHPPLTWHLG